MGASFSVCTVPIRQFKYTNLLYIVLQITIRRIGLAEKIGVHTGFLQLLF